MAEGAYDHVVLGSGPLAGLIAGLLAIEHGRRVVIVGDPASPFRLQRSFDLSVAVLTRPETLVLLKRVAAETSKLIGGIGKGLTERIDPLFIAETPASIAALSHFRHLARALGYPVEPHADRNLTEGTIVRVRDVMLLAQAKLGPALEEWLTTYDVCRLDRAETVVTLRRDGTARIVAGSLAVEAAHAILADDAAILAHLPEDLRDRSLVLQSTAAILLEPLKALAAPLTVYLDRGVTLHQDGKASVSAVVTGDPATAHARLGASIARTDPVRRAGETHFPSFATTDGAPLVTTARGGKATILAAFGATGAFLAPAIVRMIAGKASADEAAWFAARTTLRGNQRLDAAEFAPVPA